MVLVGSHQVRPRKAAFVSREYPVWGRFTSRSREVLDVGFRARFSTKLIRYRWSSEASLMVADTVVPPRARMDSSRPCPQTSSYLVPSSSNAHSCTVIGFVRP